MDIATREVRRGDRLVELTRTEFTLLEMFLRRPRRVLERSFILEEVWGYDFPTTANSLEVYVGYVRRKTEAEGEPRLIHTVRGVGYVLEGAMTPSPDRARTGTHTDDIWHYRRSLASRVIGLTTIAVGLAVAFVALGAFLTVRMQMQSTLDESLLDRAHRAAKYAEASEAHRAYRTAPLGARSRRHPDRVHHLRRAVFTPDSEADSSPSGTPSSTSRGRRVLERPDHPRGRHPLPGRHGAGVDPGPGPGDRAVARAAGADAGEAGVVMLLFGIAGVRRRGDGGLGGRPQRAAAGTPAHHRGRGDRPDRGPHPAPGRG